MILPFILAIGSNIDCSTVKHFYTSNDCCADPRKTIDTSSCKIDTHHAGPYLTQDGTNYIADEKITKSFLSHSSPKLKEVPIDPHGFPGGWATTNGRHTTVTEKHYYAIVGTAQKEKGQNFGTEVPGQGGGDSDTVTGVEIQCRSRDSDELVWSTNLADVLDLPYAYVQDVTVEKGFLYGTAYTHYQLNSGVFLFSLDALTGIKKYSMRADRMRLTFDNIEWMIKDDSDTYIPPFATPYSAFDRIPEFKVTFGNMTTAPLKIGCSESTLKVALQKLGFTHIYVQKNDPYEFEKQNKTWVRKLSNYGELSSGALSYDLIFTGTRGLHYDVTGDKGVVYDFTLDRNNKYQSGDTPALANPTPYDYKTYKMTTHMRELPEEEEYAWSLPLLHVSLIESNALVKTDPSVPFVAVAEEMNLVAAAHNAPKVIGDSVFIAVASVHYHYGLTSSVNGDYFWKRYGTDQTSVLRINRHTGNVIWLRKNGPDHLHVNQKIPESAACYDKNMQPDTHVWFRRFLTDDDALENLPEDLGEVTLFFTWGSALTDHFTSNSPGNAHDGLNTYMAAYGPQRTRSLLDQLPHEFDPNATNFLKPSGKRFPLALEGAVYIDGPKNGLVLRKNETTGLMPLIDNIDVLHPMKIKWTPTVCDSCPQKWPEEYTNMYFYYKKPIGSRISHIQESLQLMYSGASPYGNALAGYDDKTETVFYTTGHNYHIALNDLIRIVELNTDVPFDPNAYNGLPVTGGFNPAGIYVPYYMLGLDYMGFAFANALAYYAAVPNFCGNMQVFNYLNIRNTFMQTIQNEVTKDSPKSAMIDAINQAEGVFVQQLQALEALVPHLSKRGSTNFGGAAIAVDWKTGTMKWGSRNVINNVFKHGGPFTLGTTPNQGNNNGVMLLDDLHDGHTVVLSTSKTGYLDRFLLETHDEDVEVDGFVYPADITDRANQKIKMPIRKVLGVGDQWGGTVFGGWAYDKKTHTLSVMQQNSNEHLSAGAWGRPVFSPMDIMMFFERRKWVLRSGTYAGEILSQTDGVVNDEAHRYLAVVDMKEPDRSKMLINEIPVDHNDMLPPGSSSYGTFTGRILNINGLIFLVHLGATSDELSQANVSVSDNMQRFSKLSAISAFDPADGTRVWTSPWLSAPSQNIVPTYVDGEFFMMNPAYTQTQKHLLPATSSNVFSRLEL